MYIVWVYYSCIVCLLACLLSPLTNSVKLPQIIKILRARSVENLSYLANIQELAAVTFTSAYSFGKSFPFRYT